MGRTLNPKEEQLFATCAPDIRVLGLKAHRLVLNIIPGAVQQVENGNTAIHYGTGLKMADEVFYVSAHKAHVNIGLFGGAGLPDPDGLMEGTGKRLRHVKLRQPDEVERPTLRALLETALKDHQE